MSNLIMLSIWLSMGLIQTPAALPKDQKPLFPAEMFQLTLKPSNPLEGTAFDPIRPHDASMGVTYIFKNLGDLTSHAREVHPIPLLRADIPDDLRDPNSSSKFVAPSRADLIDDRR